MIFLPLTSDLSPARHFPWSNRASGRTIAKVGRSSETAQTCSADRRSIPEKKSWTFCKWHKHNILQLYNCPLFYPLGQSFDSVLIDFLCPLTYGLRRSVQFSCDLKKLISPHLPLKSNSLSFSKTSPSVTSPPSHDLKAFDQFAVGHQLWQFGETIARQTISSIVPGNAVGHPVKFAQFQQLLHFGHITEQENRTHCVFLEFSFFICVFHQ